ncbi:Nuclear transcription factor Y subunit B-8 [Zea mays]|jgi:nuclear transcription Y subunit beta|uniref:Nuclear transcription factor Y subunit B-2 n=1 Tax=Zea mays TaxID=4577 RepID=A0A1D6K5M3_MAIZE|nr:Nuclear transcription factor Y subunit B-8 [Zea mays]ONL98874.1 Nuclear transcription factor Y subunit B-2 [Zea mays]|eukprot:NP_001147638.2 nuclear transcription factor Y subunit B-3 [Zea mays]
MPDSDNDSGGPSNAGGELSSPREQDRFLPIANVSRIMKKALPANAKISKDAKETVQECVSEFISFITGEASDKCQREKRKTINGDDLLWAMTTLGFEDYVEPLKHYLHKFREIEGERAAASAGASGSQQQQQQGELPRGAANAAGYAGYGAPGSGGMMMMMMGQPMYGGSQPQQQPPPPQPPQQQQQHQQHHMAIGGRGGFGQQGGGGGSSSSSGLGRQDRA